MYTLYFRWKYAIWGVKSTFTFLLGAEVILMGSCLLYGYVYVLRDTWVLGSCPKELEYFVVPASSSFFDLQNLCVCLPLDFILDFSVFHSAMCQLIVLQVGSVLLMSCNTDQPFELSTCRKQEFQVQKHLWAWHMVFSFYRLKLSLASVCKQLQKA